MNRSVGETFKRAGHEVLYLQENIPTGSPDPVVCMAAELNQCILVAQDGDMKRIAQGHGVSGKRFKNLSVIKLSCRETSAPERVRTAMTFIEREWASAETSAGRRIFIEIGDTWLRINR